MNQPLIVLKLIGNNRRSQSVMIYQIKAVNLTKLIPWLAPRHKTKFNHVYTKHTFSLTAFYI